MSGLLVHPAPKTAPESREDAEALSLAGFIGLAGDQIVAALGEADRSFGRLTTAVLGLAAGQDAADRARDADDALASLQAIDRLQQRLGNVERNLRRLAAIVEHHGGRPGSREWQAFLADARGAYTTETERTEFDAARDRDPFD